MSKEDKKDIQELIKKLEKEFGQGALMSLDSDDALKVDVNSTGSLLLNKALGVGGYPKGRIIEIFGPESSGKTTMALSAVAQVQKAGGRAAFIDAEHAIDPNFAKKIGVDIKSLIVSQPDSGEQAMDIVEQLVSSEMIDLIVVDSVAALVPQIELEGSAYEQTIGAQARLLSKSLRKLTGILSKTNTTIIFINQIREKVGVIFGNPEVTPGGRALKFFSSIRLDIRIAERLKNGDEHIGQRVKIKVVKNKMSSPHKICEVEIFYDRGIDQTSELLDLAVQKEVIQKAGTWYSYKDVKLGQGRNEVCTKLREDKKLYDEIFKKTM